ncbi:helix-turn-helix transcriptional regulator [Devosia sp. A16]|uniref:helix-turn-helix transcriptional regulator n=1 Tax=Devosia sp. A16 TaxID=1736675 RepID=UPI0006D76869|nr:helix-turn-helix transcriptional regulator [Devosia sp. A16]
MGLISEFGKLTRLVYDAADGAGNWMDFVNEAGRVFDAVHAVLTTEAPDRGTGMAEGASHLWVQYHCGAYGGRDPLMERAWRLPRGTLSLVQQIDEDPVLANSDFYRSFLAHNGLRHFMHVLLPQGPGRVAFFCLTRSDQKPPFSSDEIEAVEALMPHLQRALRSGSGAHGMTLFETSPYGLILLDRHGRTICANNLALGLLDALDGVSLKVDFLHLAGLREMTPAARSGGLARPIAFRIERPRADTPLTALLTAVPEEWRRHEGRDAVALLVLSDPGSTSYPDAAVLMGLYGLTPREARFAQTLVETRGMRPTSNELGISPETARRHLKSVFEKTRTHSQSELIHLLVRHPAAFLGQAAAPEVLQRAS